MKKTLEERFWEKVRKGDGCWEWTAHLNMYGYGTIRDGDKFCSAHRVSWKLHFGPIPRGLCVCHRCDNPKCVCPSHLFLGTVADNARDRESKGRAVYLRGERNGMAKLTAPKVLAIRRERLVSNTSVAQLALRYGVCKSTIGYVISGERWGHV